MRFPRLPERRFLAIVLMGFSSGLPLALTASTLTVRLTEAGVDKATIGLFAGVALAYAFKFLGAPFVDRLRLPLLTRALGRRRAWLAATQVALAVFLLGMGHIPSGDALLIALAALAVAIFSALQDIAVDAWRIERLNEDEQGYGAACAVLGYRLGMIASSAGALHLASHVDWQATYTVMAALMGVGLITTLCCREPAASAAVAASQNATGIREWFAQSVLAPLKDFFTRTGWALPLLLVFCYKLPDAFSGIMSNPFFLQVGFTKAQIADIVKLYGIAASIAGGFLGGYLVKRYGVLLCLALGSAVCAASILLYLPLVQSGPDTRVLACFILMDNVGGGIGTCALVAYISDLCNRRYTATQYALLSSLAASARAICAMPAGWVAGVLGWQAFFILSALMGLPGLLLIFLLWRRSHKKASPPG